MFKFIEFIQNKDQHYSIFYYINISWIMFTFVKCTYEFWVCYIICKNSELFNKYHCIHVEHYDRLWPMVCVHMAGALGALYLCVCFIHVPQEPTRGGCPLLRPTSYRHLAWHGGYTRACFTYDLHPTIIHGSARPKLMLPRSPNVLYSCTPPPYDHMRPLRSHNGHRPVQIVQGRERADDALLTTV